MGQPIHVPQSSSIPAPTNISWTKPYPYTKPPNQSSKFKELTPAEKERLDKKGACQYCRKTDHNPVHCHYTKNQIGSTAGPIRHKITEFIHSNKITSASQFIMEDLPLLYTKDNSSQPPLDAGKEHLVVTMKISHQPAEIFIN